MADQIVWTIKHVCESEEIDVPDIITEFGAYTVGESAAAIFKVIGQKKQNDKELRYMVNSSLITTLPDIWGIDQKFIVLPINGWDNDYTNVIIGGITCDNDDFYNKDAKGNQIILPAFDQHKEDLYI
jgi:arginine decarboxylase